MCSGWMMFQYLVSGLATGATIVLYEGSPLKRPESLWEMVDDLGITIFGTSAKWIEQISVGRSKPVSIAMLTRSEKLPKCQRETLPKDIAADLVDWLTVASCPFRLHLHSRQVRRCPWINHRRLRHMFSLRRTQYQPPGLSRRDPIANARV